MADLLYAYQRRWVELDNRFNWFCASRQVGKSHGLTLRRIMRGLKRRRDQIFVSAGQRQSRELMRKAAQHLEAMRLATQVAIGEEDVWDPFAGVNVRVLEITVPQFNMRILGLPANPQTVRGYTGDVLLDEFAMHPYDAELWAALFPSVSRDDGELDVASTPKGRGNTFYRIKQSPVFHHETLTIHDAVAEGCPQDPEQLRAAIMDEQIWRQEFLCEFVDEATAFLTYEQIGQCEDPNLDRDVDLESLADHTGNCYLGVDIGRKHDLTVLWVFERIGSTLISRGLIELRAMPFRQQFEHLSSLLRCGCVRRACIDATGLGMQLAEEAQERFGAHRVEACTFTASFKDAIASAMRNKFTDKELRIPVCERIRNDLHSVQRIVTAAGNVRLQAPREESHADRFWAAALAVHAAGEVEAKIEGTFGRRLHAVGLRTF